MATGEGHQKHLIIRLKLFQYVCHGAVQTSLDRTDAAASIDKQADGDWFGFERKMFHRFGFSIFDYFEVVRGEVKNRMSALILNQNVEHPQIHIDNQNLARTVKRQTEQAIRSRGAPRRSSKCSLATSKDFTGRVPCLASCSASSSSRPSSNAPRVVESDPSSFADRLDFWE